jgi:hypothetical protein
MKRVGLNPQRQKEKFSFIYRHFVETLHRLQVLFGRMGYIIFVAN